MVVTTLMYLNIFSLLLPRWLCQGSNEVLEEEVYYMEECPISPEHFKCVSEYFSTWFPTMWFTYSANFHNETGWSTNVTAKGEQGLQHIVIFCGSVFGAGSTGAGSWSMTFNHLLISTNNIVAFHYHVRDILLCIGNVTRLDGNTQTPMDFTNPFNDTLEEDGCVDYEASINTTRCEATTNTTVELGLVVESSTQANTTLASSRENVTKPTEYLGQNDSDIEEEDDEDKRTSDSSEKEGVKDEPSSSINYTVFIVVGFVVALSVVVIILAVLLTRRMFKQTKRTKERPEGTTNTGTESPTSMSMSTLKQKWQGMKDKKARKPEQSRAELVEEFNLGRKQAPNPALEDQHTVVAVDSLAGNFYR